MDSIMHILPTIFLMMRYTRIQLQALPRLQAISRDQMLFQRYVSQLIDSEIDLLVDAEEDSAVIEAE